MAGLQLGLLHAGDLDKTRSPDYPLAEKWLRRAAEAGQAAAAKRLVQLFETGLLVLTTAEQVKLLAQASDGGDGYASWRLGQRLSAADSADRDIAAATRRYRMGVEQGFHLAAYHLALLYKEGAIGGRSDMRAAIPLMERAAELGNPVADLYLGQWHEFGERDGGGHLLVPVDVDKARHFYEAAARKGSAAGVLHLGELYDTAAFGRRDPATARQYYERAAGFEKDRGTSAMALAHIARHDREDQLAASKAPLEVARGNPDATVEVLVYTELDCTTCGRFYRDVLRPIVDKFIDRGLIRLVMRGSGTEARASSMEALVVASCAGQEVRTRVAERILEYQAQWTTSEQRLQALFKLVEPLLPEPDRLRTCLADGANRDRLRRAIAGDPLKEVGVGNLPAVFVNGEIFEGPKLTELEFGLIRALPPQSRGPVWQR
jgi:TPR repeat protein